MIGELGYWSLWASQRRIRGWLGNPVWRSTTFWTAGELRDFAQTAGLREITIRGAIHYPPFGWRHDFLPPLIFAWVDMQHSDPPSWTFSGQARLIHSATHPENNAGE